MFRRERKRDNLATMRASDSVYRTTTTAINENNASRVNTNTDEFEYLNLMSRILEHGSVENTRTGVRTKTLFGEMLKFNLSDNTLPLLTTKHVSVRNVLHELLWFMSGSTNLKMLERYGVNIWHENASPEYLESVGLSHRYQPYTDLGPIYSHQWRHYGAKYTDCFTNYKGQV